jgi:hypothetical protein
VKVREAKRGKVRIKERSIANECRGKGLDAYNERSDESVEKNFRAGAHGVLKVTCLVTTRTRWHSYRQGLCQGDKTLNCVHFSHFTASIISSKLRVHAPSSNCDLQFVISETPLWAASHMSHSACSHSSGLFKYRHIYRGFLKKNGMLVQNDVLEDTMRPRKHH